MFRLVGPGKVDEGQEALAKALQPFQPGEPPIWLQVLDPSPEELGLLQVHFGLHQLALDDCLRAEQRPKIEDYVDYLFVVVYGTTGRNSSEVELQEINFFLLDGGIISVSYGSSPELEEAAARLQDPAFPFPASPPQLFYLLAIGLVDSFFPLLEDMDDRIDALQDKIVTAADPKLLQELFGMKQTLVRLRKILSPQRDLFLSLSSPLHSYLKEDDLPYLRNLHDHVTRAYEQVDSYRDLLTGAMDVYLSTVSNRLGDVMKRLTIVATVFMPLSFLTGFFGMNFAYLTGKIQTSEASFFALVVLMVLIAAAMVWWFRRRRWL